MRIAFATKDNTTVDDHFGWCTQFAVYEVNPSGFKFHELREVDGNPPIASLENVGKGGFDDEMDKIDKRIKAIKDCAIVYCSQIGPTAAARVVRERIHPITVRQPESIDDVLNKVTEVLKRPPIWLRKIMEKEAL